MRAAPDAEAAAVVIIPARDEEAAIGEVVRAALGQPDVARVIVADNGSRDATSARAAAAGARVAQEPRAGYGRACLAGVAASGDAAILVFMDGDGADDPADMAALLAPILAGEADLVVGSRALGRVERGALTPPQRFGNALAAWLIRRIWRVRVTDLGPFRALTRTAYESLSMSAPTYGWTVQMQVRAAKRGLRMQEIPAGYRRRVGVSKISGTIRGVVLAGAYILGTIAWEALTPPPRSSRRAGARDGGGSPPARGGLRRKPP